LMKQRRPPAAAGRVPARGVPARARLPRPHRGAQGDARHAGAPLPPARSKIIDVRGKIGEVTLPRYPDLLTRLERARALGVELGLERVRAALARLGDPQRRFAAVQIAGT